MGKEQLFMLVVVMTPLFWGLVVCALWRFWNRKSVAGRVLGAEAALLAADKAMMTANSRIDKIEAKLEIGYPKPSRKATL